MDIGQIILDTLRNPNIAYVLLVTGLFLAILAFAVPGTGIVEISAVLCLILAIIGLSQLDVYFAGLALILLGIGAFIMDLKLQSGAIAIGGALLLGTGSLFLFVPTATQEGVSLWLIGLVTLGSLAFFTFGVNRAILAMRIRPKTGIQNLKGSTGIVRVELNASNQLTGSALIGSELWTVKSNEPLAQGTPVVVDQVDGLVLHVTKSAQ
ncbi:MAG: hypothetical protein M1434_04850 [Chloroflexi bacterium]|nr:hypothetical protein [Chloroflexota bacterium]MCL5274061.1 hypothetical protein [Chloroflexota bacterium]